MKTLDHFSIPYKGLKNGMHTFHFNVDDSFFDCFEKSIIQRGSVKVDLYFDRRSDLASAEFHCEGSVVVNCDRCLLDFNYPIETDFTLLIKEGEVDPDEDEVIFIDEYTSIINVAQYIYEWVTISLPMIRMHEDIADCDPDVIKKLNGSDSESDKDSIWTNLKNMNFEN